LLLLVLKNPYKTNACTDFFYFDIAFLISDRLIGNIQNFSIIKCRTVRRGGLSKWY